MAKLEKENDGVELEIDEPLEMEEEEEEKEYEEENDDESNLEFLLSNIDSENIAEDIDQDILDKIARQVIRDYERDEKSMGEWAGIVESGQDLAKQDLNSKDNPWPNASNYKTTSVTGASIAFGDRAATEVIRSKNLVKSEIIGPDPEGMKRKASKRIGDFVNWQINHDMVDWRQKQKSMFYELAACGAAFKKTFFDTLTGKNCSEVIPFPNYIVNQAVQSLDDGDEFTHILDISQNQLKERQRAGMWLNVDIYGDKPDQDEGSNAQQEVDEAFDNTQKFLEQNCWYDLDDDGYAEPYTITVHKEKSIVLRIVARYNEQSLFVKGNGGKPHRLVKDQPTQGYELVRIEALNPIVKYEFIPDPKGGYLGLGYYHTLSSLAKTVNGTTNQLMDSGTLSNLQGGFVAKGFRQKMGNVKTRPGEWNSTDISAQDLRNGIVPWAFKEPSATLLQLNEMNKKEMRDATVNLDLQGVLAPNAPATTTLALIQESMLPASARLQSIIDSMSKEFMNLFALNAEFVDPAQYKRIVDDPKADFNKDFDIDAQNMLPTANPEMSSRMQRIAQADAIMAQLPFLVQTGADMKEIVNMWLDALGAEELKDKVFPTDDELSEEQKAKQQQQQAAQQKQDQLEAIQIDLQERDMEAKEAEIQLKNAENQVKSLKIKAEIEKLKAETIKTLEEAETEHSTNQINKYTAEFDMVERTVNNAGKSFKSQADSLTGNTNDNTRQVQSAT